MKYDIIKKKRANFLNFHQRDDLSDKNQSSSTSLPHWFFIKTSQVAPRYLTGFLFFHGISILGFQRVTLQERVKHICRRLMWRK